MYGIWDTPRTACGNGLTAHGPALQPAPGSGPCPPPRAKKRPRETTRTAVENVWCAASTSSTTSTADGDGSPHHPHMPPQPRRNRVRPPLATGDPQECTLPLNLTTPPPTNGHGDDITGGGTMGSGDHTSGTRATHGGAPHANMRARANPLYPADPAHRAGFFGLWGLLCGLAWRGRLWVSAWGWPVWLPGWVGA